MAEDAIMDVVLNRALARTGFHPGALPLRRQMQAVIQEYRTALSEAGLAIVPVEPSERMREAGGRIIDPYNMTRTEAADVVYRAMLAAAEES